tara:strand:- start:62 stop:1222 length:1161 start_codon:yes stop_codon:yes gene_type:complete
MAFKQNNPLSRKTSPINKDWIKGAIKRPGAFRKKAEEAGMSTKAFAEKVTSNKEDYSTRTGRQAELAETLMGMSRHEKDHDDKTFTMDELNERSKKQDSLSKKQALKLPQREGLGNPDYEFNEDQRFAGDDGYDDGMSRKSSPHGTYADQGYIKSYKKGNKYVAVDKSEHDSYQDERIASAQALTRARKKARKAKAAKKGVSRKSSGRNPYTNSPVGDLSGDKVYGPATAAISVGKKIYKKGKEFVAGAAKIGKKVKKAVKASKNVTGTGEAPRLMMKKTILKKKGLTKIKPKKSISRKSSPINNKEKSKIDVGLIKEAERDFKVRRPKTQGDSISLTNTMRRMGKDPQSMQDSRLDFYDRAGKKGGLLSRDEKIAAMKLKRNKKQ